MIIAFKNKKSRILCNIINLNHNDISTLFIHGGVH
jgi:hypothetical protein